MSVPFSLKPSVFLELFSGSGHLGKAVVLHNNWPVLLWDLSLGGKYDLRLRRNRCLIAGWIRSGTVRAGHLGTPCNTFSRARDRPPGPMPLRSDACVLGLPNLSPKDQQAVSEGNLYMRFSVFILQLALLMCIPFTLENPARSRIWLCPPVLRLLRRRKVQQVFFEMCMFGTPWKKPTSLVGVHIQLETIGQHRCIGTKRGCCKRTGDRHVVLCGSDAKGNWKTKRAQTYPHAFCRSLARCFLDFEVQTRAEIFSMRLK